MDLEGVKTGTKTYRLTKDSNTQFFEFLGSLKDGEEFGMKMMSKSQIRSLKQNRYYYSQILPACQYYLDELNHCPDRKRDRDVAHYNLKLIYCCNVKPEYIEVFKIRDPRTGQVTEKAFPFSWSISEMSAKNANDYINYCISLVEQRTGQNIDRALSEIER